MLNPLNVNRLIMLAVLFHVFPSSRTAPPPFSRLPKKYDVPPFQIQCQLFSESSCGPFSTSPFQFLADFNAIFDLAWSNFQQRTFS